MISKAAAIHAPLTQEEDQRGKELIAKALGLSHISCEGCLRAASKGDVGPLTEMYGYQDDQHGIYWTWMISRAREIAKRDAIPAEPIPWDMLEAAIAQAAHAANHEHVGHLPYEAATEPVLVAMLPVQPFGASMIIDGNHRLLWNVIRHRQPMMQVLSPVQSVEALVTQQDKEEAIRRAEAIIRGALMRGIDLR